MAFFHCLKKICKKQRLKKKKKEETIPHWINVRNHEFKKIKERVNNFVNKIFYAKVGNKTIAMIPVKSLIVHKRLKKGMETLFIKMKK